MVPRLASNLYDKGELNLSAFTTQLQVLLSCITTFVFMWLVTEHRISFMLGCHSPTKTLSQTKMYDSILFYSVNFILLESTL